jgi:ketosteroid isomerase-like protein
MRQENVEIVLEQFALTGGRDAGHVIAAWADDVELVNAVPGAIRGTHFAGKADVIGWFRDWFASFENDVQFEVTSAEEVAEGTVLVTANHRARGKGSGIDVEMEVVWVFEVRDAKITRMTHYRAKADALAALREVG